MQSTPIATNTFIPFPSFAKEKHYMVPFTKEEGLPNYLSHWQPTVDAMLQDIHNSKEIYLMVDQSIINPNEYHRRPGMHVDGYWEGPLLCHGGNNWRLNSNSHRPPVHSASKDNQLIMLASTNGNTAFYEGTYDEVEWNGGSYEHLNPNNFKQVISNPNQLVYGDSCTLLHESLPVTELTNRTLVRLNVNYY